MKKNKLVHFDLDLYSETLDNGLEINIVPKNTVNSVYVTFSTKYGSIHDEFIPIDSNEYYKVPMGVAHFLEHKVFEQKDGTDPFTVFSANGADANANTSNFKTTYLFSGTTKLKENLNYLLDFVQSPYFTDANVEKEKGIIAQELKMLMDDPNWQLYDKSIFNSFVKHPIMYPIGGTLKSISKITKEDLYTCYNTFYHPHNMFITITGNVDPSKTIKIIKDNQAKKKFDPFKEITIKTYDEPDEVKTPYKINRQNYDINRLRIYLNIYFSLILGSTSILSEDLRKQNLISNNLSYDSISTDKHILYSIDFESENYDKVLEAIKSEKYDTIILNFANCDMVGHTTVFDATVKAVETVDECLGKIVKAVNAVHGTLVVTADHGNADKMLDEEGKPFSAHSTNPVPFIIVKKGLNLRDGGNLGDITPTMLELLGIKQPVEMTGKSLIVKENNEQN